MKKNGTLVHLHLMVWFLAFGLFQEQAYAACSGPVADEGSIEYFSGTNQYKVCNGTSWLIIDLDAGASGTCSVERSWEYDSTNKVPEICSGGNLYPITCVGGTGSCTTYGACSNSGDIEYVSGQGFRWCDGANYLQISTTAPSGPDTTATHFLLSGPTSVINPECTAFTVSLLNASNEPVAAGSLTSVNLTSTGAGTFYTDSSCGASTTSVDIASGETSTTFYFIATGLGAYTMTADDAGALSPDTLNYNGISSASGSNCSGANGGTPNSTASYGNVYDPGGSAGAYAKNQDCQYWVQPTVGGKMVLNLTTVDVEAGGDYIYMYDNGAASGTQASGSPWTGSVAPPTIDTMTSSGNAFIDFIEDGDSKVGAGFSITWRAYGGTKLAFQAGSATPIDEESCQSYVIERQNASSVAVTSPYSTNVNLSTTSSGGSFYLNNSCTQAATSTFISGDSTSVTVYYKDGAPGAWVLTASDADVIFDNGTFNLTVTEAVNDAPVAVNDNLNTDVDVFLDITLSTDVFANDTDEEGNAISLNSIVATSVEGGTIVDQGGGVYRYTPPASYLGRDSFTYTVKDTLNAVSNTATVNIQVGIVSPPASWTENLKLKTMDTVGTGTVVAGDLVGFTPNSIATFGSIVVMGAASWTNGGNTQEGRVLVLRDPNGDGDWSDYVLDKQFNSPAGIANGYFGFNVAIYGNVIAVAEPDFGSSTGNGNIHLFIDANNDGNWSDHSGAAITINSSTDFGRPAEDEQCGYGLALGDGILAFGCPSNNDQDSVITDTGTGVSVSGAILIVRDTSAGGNWSSYVLDEYLKAPSIRANQRFGAAIDFDGTTLIVANDAENAAGTAFDEVYVYRDPNADGDWSDVAHRGTLADANGVDDDFGQSISVLGDVIVIGAVKHDGGTTDGGAVFVYRDTDTDGIWGEASELDKQFYEDTPATGSFFGFSVVIKGAGIFVGAYGVSSSAGKAYVYEDPNTDGTWTDMGTSKSSFVASNAEAGDSFARNMVVDDSLGFYQMYVAAPYEDSDGPTVNNNNAADSGAVYVFTPESSGLGAFSISGITGGSDNTADSSLDDGTDPTITWTTSTGAAKYDVLIKDSTGTTTLCSSLDAAGPSASPTGCGLAYSTSYKVYITAANSGDTLTLAASNEPFDFSVAADPSALGAFNITGVTGGTDNTVNNNLSDGLDATIHWTDSTNATEYDLVIKDSTGTSSLCSALGVTASSASPTGCGLADGLSYKAYVMAKDGASGTLAASNEPYSFSVGATGGGGGGQANQLAAEVPTRLYITGESSIGTNSCASYTISTIAPYGANVRTLSNVTVNLSGIGSGAFYSNSGCTTSTTTATVNSGDYSTVVYYKNATAEAVQLVAADASATLDSGSLGVNLYSKILKLTGPAVLPSGATCGAATGYQIEYLNGDGTPYGSSISVHITGYEGGSGGSANAIYTASGCSGGSKISGTGPVTVSGTGPYNFYFSPGITADKTFRVYPASETGVLEDTLFVDVSGIVPSSVLVRGANLPSVSTCTKYDLVFWSGTAVKPVSLDTSVTLASTGSAQIYSDRNCSTTTSSVVVAAGSSSGVFYVKDATAESVTLTATPAGMSASNLAVNFVSANVTTPLVTVGERHSCSLSAKGTIKCWGDNTYSQMALGYSSSTSFTTPEAIRGITQTATHLDAGGWHTCAVMSDSTVQCWGRNNYGQLGNSSTSTVYTPVQVTGINNAVAVSAGYYHSCALLSDQTVKCWGNNSYGVLGNNSQTNASSPVVVTGLAGVTAISSGYYHTCALLTDDTAKCWGNNLYGQVGTGDTTSPQLTATSVTTLNNVESISAGTYYSCATLTSGATKCWGHNGWGELGDSSTTNSNVPVTVASISTATQVSAGGAFNAQFTCSLLSDQTAMCWGSNVAGQLGDGNVSETPVSTPVAVESLAGVISLDVGFHHACAQLSDERVKCWGSNDYGKLGNGSRASVPYPIEGPVSNVNTLAAGSDHVCALLNDGSVKCWGSNKYGQLGNGTTSTYMYESEPLGDGTAVEVSGLSGVSVLAAGDYHNCAIVAGEVKCWGYNFYGQLGDGTTTHSDEPVAVSGISTATHLALGAVQSCARLSDSTIKCWGGNQYGSLGDGTAPTHQYTPVTVSGINNAVDVTAGAQHTCARLSDQTIKCWGLNTNAQMGDPAYPTSTTYLATPVVAGTNMTGVASLIAGRSSHICAVKTDNAVYCWGFNDYGMLGNGLPPSNFEYPGLPVTGLTNISSLALGAYHGCAVMPDSTLRCWARNANGQLGDGTFVDKPTIIQPPISGVESLSAGDYFTCAVYTDDTTSCWGYNGKRNFGLNFSIPLYVVDVP